MKKPSWQTIVAWLVSLSLITASVSAVVLAPSESASASSPGTAPLMPRSWMPSNGAGDLLYYQYTHNDYPVAAYECAYYGTDVAGYLGMTGDISACMDWRLIIDGHSVKVRMFHAVDYYRRFYISQAWAIFFNNVFQMFLTFAKVVAGFGATFYWVAEHGVCAATVGYVTAHSGNPAYGGLAGGACEWAFDNYNPFGGI